MSSEQGSVDSATIEKTKQQIRGLVQEIAQLSRSDLEPDQYYAEVMHRIVTALAAIGGAVWTINNERQLRLDYQINLKQNLLDPQSEEAQRHVRLLQQVISSGEAKLVPPLSGAGDSESAGNPTNSLLVLAPMKSDDSVEGVLEIFQRPDSQTGSQKGYLRFLLQMSDLVGDYLKSRKLRSDCSILALFMNLVFVREGAQVALQMGSQGRGQKVIFSLVFAILAPGGAQEGLRERPREAQACPKV